MTSIKLSVSLLCAALQASACIASMPPALVLPGGFDFRGDWACRGAFRGGQAHKSLFHGELAVGGTWLELDEADQEPATGYLARYLVGYDTHARQFVEFDASNSAAGVYKSDVGWVKGALTLVSDPLKDTILQYVRDRFVYTITGARSFSVDWQVIKRNSTQWLEGDHLDCTVAK